MEAVQKEHWYFVVLIFLPFLRVAVQQREPVTVRLEEGMVLDCLCPWEGNFSMVSWTKMPDKHPIAVFHPQYGSGFSRYHRERIEFLRTTPMDGSITMWNVTHQDIGSYQCSVQTFPLGPWTRIVQVEDLDEPPGEEDEEKEQDDDDDDDDDDHDDNAAEPPTPEGMVADIELMAELDGNITISCSHKHNGTVSQALLERMLYDRPSRIIGVCKQVEGGLVAEDYSDVGRVGCTDGLDVSLHLTGLGLNDGGFYRCIFSTDAGVRTTTVLLTVAAPGGISLSLYMLYVYIGAGTAGLLLVIVILILTLRQRKKTRRRRRREEYRVKLQPAQRQMKIKFDAHPQPIIYENMRKTEASRQMRSCPVYVNLPTARPWKIRCPRLTNGGSGRGSNG